MGEEKSFRRRGIVEGFFGPLWSMAHRKELFEFGAARGMNTYLYAPKDDPYHRKYWRRPYPARRVARGGKNSLLELFQCPIPDG